jgi:hypothetical protein
MNEKQLFKSTWLKWGVILGVATLAFSFIQYLMGVFGKQGWNYLGLLINIAVLYLAFAAYKQANNGYMKYGRSIGIAAMIGLIGGLIGGILLTVYLNLDAGMMDQMIDNSIESSMAQFESRGLEMDEEVLREQMNSDTAKMFMNLGMAIGIPVMSLIANVLIALVLGAIMKNNPPEGHSNVTPVADA